MNKKNIKKLAHAFNDDLNKNLKKTEFRKTFYNDLLKLQIANEIIKLREKRGESQAELARKIKTTQAVVSRIENGKVCASTNVLQRICNAYQVEARFQLS